MPIDPEIEEALRQPPQPVPAPKSKSRIGSWRPIFDVTAGGIMFALAFIGIAASDVTSRSQTYWSVIAVVFGLICLGLDWVHEPRGTAWWKAALRTGLHWFGVLMAIELVYFLIASGRLTNANVGLMNGTIVALGTFTSGVHTNWRVATIGVALGLGTAAVAYVEQYLWILLILAVVTLGIIVAIARFRSRRDA